MALLSHDTAFYVWVAATRAVAASVAAGIAWGWCTGRRFRAEDVAAGRFRVPLMLVGALLYQISRMQFTVHVTLPEARRSRGGAEAVGVEAAMERFMSNEAYVWPIGFLMLGVVVLLIYASAANRRTPPPRVEGQEEAAGGSSLVETVTFVVCVWVCVYDFPVMVRHYMLATGCRTMECDHPSFRTHPLE